MNYSQEEFFNTFDHFHENLFVHRFTGKLYRCVPDDITGEITAIDEATYEENIKKITEGIEDFVDKLKKSMK